MAGGATKREESEYPITRKWIISMKVELRLEQTNEYQFGTARSAIGPRRFLLITVCGRPFSVWHELDDLRASWDENYMRNVDEMLGKEFERMAEKIIKAAFSLVPEGIDIVKLSDKQIQSVLRTSHSSAASNKGR